jgi:hypothetical protein
LAGCGKLLLEITHTHGKGDTHQGFALRLSPFCICRLRHGVARPARAPRFISNIIGVKGFCSIAPLMYLGQSEKFDHDSARFAHMPGDTAEKQRKDAQEACQVSMLDAPWRDFESRLSLNQKIFICNNQRAFWVINQVCIIKSEYRFGLFLKDKNNLHYKTYIYIYTLVFDLEKMLLRVKYLC